MAEFMTERVRVINLISELSNLAGYARDFVDYLYRRCEAAGSYKNIEDPANEEGALIMFPYTGLLEYIVSVEYLLNYFGTEVDMIKRKELEEYDNDDYHISYSDDVRGLINYASGIAEHTTSLIHFLHRRAIASGGYENIKKAYSNKENLFENEFNIYRVLKRIYYYEKFLKKLNINVEKIKKEKLENFMEKKVIIWTMKNK